MLFKDLFEGKISKENLVPAVRVGLPHEHEVVSGPHGSNHWDVYELLNKRQNEKSERAIESGWVHTKTGHFLDRKTAMRSVFSGKEREKKTVGSREDPGLHSGHLKEAHTPDQLNAAKVKHQGEVKKKTENLSRHKSNFSRVSKVDPTGLSKKKKLELKSYNDMFTDRIVSTEHKLKRHNQALDAIRRIQSPTKQETKAKKVADQKRQDTLGRSTGILATFRRLFKS